jgi:hypothetical protein
MLNIYFEKSQLILQNICFDWSSGGALNSLRFDSAEFSTASARGWREAFVIFFIGYSLGTDHPGIR